MAPEDQRTVARFRRHANLNYPDLRDEDILLKSKTLPGSMMNLKLCWKDLWDGVVNPVKSILDRLRSK